MRFMYTLGLLSLFLSALLWPSRSQATHVRAGEITTRRISTTSLTYEITFTAYYDETSEGQQAANAATESTICFGDGTQQVVQRQPRKYINNRTSSINVYRVVHTYPG
ncbi:gliding motility-associated C-terminal domain-containing protein, partial [Spirosoma sp. BT702]|nr:gliding motility-associated C-terminal domain-containing protein [Spirosoma profusum]